MLESLNQILIPVVFVLGVLVFLLWLTVLWLERQRRIAAEYTRYAQEDAAEAYEAEEAETPAELPLSTVPKNLPFLSLITRRRILTANEEEFFHRLLRALPDHHVFPQVAVSAIIKPIDALKPEKDRHDSVFRKFSQKKSDFVICSHQSLNVVAVIELDDKSHTDPDKDWRRDGLLRAGGYITLRYLSRNKPSEAKIRRDLGLVS